MCTSAIDHTSNGYYPEVMEMRTIFCIIQGRDKITEVYYRRFDAAISMDELEKCNAITHMELNESYMDGYGEDGTNRFQSMCLVMYTGLDQYSGIWNYLNNSTLLGADNYQKTPTAAYEVLCH